MISPSIDELNYRDLKFLLFTLFCYVLALFISFTLVNRDIHNNNCRNFKTPTIGGSIADKLNKIRSRNMNNVVIGLLHVNSFRNKYDGIRSIIPGNIDVMIIVETKLEDSFPTSQFYIVGYAMPFRRDRNKFGGGILIYVREDIPCKLLKSPNFPDDIEGLFIELNFRKSRLLLLGTYHPPA